MLETKPYASEPPQLKAVIAQSEETLYNYLEKLPSRSVVFDSADLNQSSIRRMMW